MATIRVSSNSKEISSFYRVLARRQIPFALSNAINDTAKDAQQDQRERQRRVFTVRQKGWVDQGVKIKPFSKKTTLFAVIAIDPAGDRDHVLTKFEDERTKRPFGRSNWLAVPSKQLRRTPTGAIPKNLRPKALKFRKTSSRVSVGEKRTVLIRRKSGGVFIFQRFGRKGKTTLRLLYHFEKQGDISGTRLAFVTTVTKTVRRTFDAHFVRQFDRAVRSTR